MNPSLNDSILETLNDKPVLCKLYSFPYLLCLPQLQTKTLSLIGI